MLSTYNKKRRKKMQKKAQKGILVVGYDEFGDRIWIKETTL